MLRSTVTVTSVPMITGAETVPTTVSIVDSAPTSHPSSRTTSPALAATPAGLATLICELFCLLTLVSTQR